MIKFMSNLSIKLLKNNGVTALPNSVLLFFGVSLSILLLDITARGFIGRSRPPTFAFCFLLRCPSSPPTAAF